MKNHITESIFEAAATLPAIEGVAAIEQLLIEAAGQFPEAEPAGFSYHHTHSGGNSNPRFTLQTKLTEPWPLDYKIFTGSGKTPAEAYHKLLVDMGQWFNSLHCIEVHNHDSEVITDAFLSETNTDLRTEFYAA